MGAYYQYFTARKTSNGFQTDGIPSCQLGSKISHSSGDKVHGVYAEWFWNANQLTVRNDYSGYYPVFYYADSDQVMVSNSIIKLIALGAPADYNKEALSVFCRCGFFLADQTPFQKIRALLPNATLVWQDGSVSVDWQLRITKAEKINPQEAVDGYIDLFRKAMERRQPLTENFALPLTGGRDSRQILLELNRQGKLPKLCVTCGEERDVILAKKLTYRLNANHYTLVCDRRATEYIWRKNIATHFCALEHAWIMGLGDYLTANFDEIYEGTGVGILTRSELLIPELVDLYEEGRLTNIAEWLFDTVGPGEKFLQLLPARFRFLAQTRDMAIELVANELKQHSGAANPLTSFNFWNWNRRATSLLPFGIESRISELSTPFLDKDLYDFVSSFTPRLIFEREPQTQAIRKAFPEFGNIPFYNELPRQKSNKRSFTSRCRNALDRVFMVAKCNPSNLPVIWKAHSLQKRNSLTERNKGMQRNALLYLSQLSYCDSRANAQQILAKYTDISERIDNTYRDSGAKLTNQST
jgi:hypothetical protein